MSYSRWSHSDWYAFHDCYSGKTLDTQVLCLWLRPSAYHKSFTYTKLKSFEDVLELFIKSNYDDLANDQVSKAIVIIKEFMNDMEEEYVRQSSTHRMDFIDACSGRSES